MSYYRVHISTITHFSECNGQFKYTQAIHDYDYVRGEENVLYNIDDVLKYNVVIVTNLVGKWKMAYWKLILVA